MPIEEKDGWIHVRPDVVVPPHAPSDDEDEEHVHVTVPEKSREPESEGSPS